MTHAMEGSGGPRSAAVHGWLLDGAPARPAAFREQVMPSMQPSTPSPARLRRYGPIAGALVPGVVVTALVFGLLWRDAREADQLRLDRLTHFLREGLDDRTEKYEQYLVVVREFLTENPRAESSPWEQLLGRLKLPTNCRGLTFLAYAPRLGDGSPVPASTAGASDGRATDLADGRGMPAAERWPVTLAYARPPARAPRLGADLSRSSIPWGPAWVSVYRNALTVTPRLSSGTNTDGLGLSGFCMIHTVYDPALPAEIPRLEGESDGQAWERTLDLRIRHWRGTLVAAIDMDELLAEMLQDRPREVAFEIFDNLDLAQRQRLNDRIALPSPDDRARRSDLTNRVMAWPMYGGSWGIEFHPTAEFERQSPRRVAWIALWAGMGGTIGFTWLVGLQLHARLAAESHSRSMNEARDVIDTLSRQQRRISRDLHDGVLQSLYALGLGLQKTRRAIGSEPAVAEERCRRNLEALELAMADLRRHVGAHRSGVAPEPELGRALGELVATLNSQGTIPVRLTLDPALRTRPLPGATLELIQIAREAITNGERHSRARLIRVCLESWQDGFALRIVDDGRGLDPSAPRGHGLGNMAARAAEIGAQFRLDAVPGGGTRVSVLVPGASCHAPWPGESPGPEESR